MAVPTVSDTATTNIATLATSHAVNLPTHAAGDLLLMFFENGSARTATVPDDWTAIYNQSVTGGAFQTMLAWRYATADHGSTVTVSLDGTTAVLAIVVAISGAENPATTAIANGLSSGTSGSSVVAPSFTATHSDSLILAMAVDSGGAQTFSTPSGYTQLASLENTASFDDMALYSRNTGAAAGTVAAATLEASSAYTWRSYHAAIAPAAGGASAIPAFVHHRRLLGVQ